MRELWEKIASSVSDAGAFIEEVSRNGIRFLRSSIGSLPLFTSTSADTEDKTLDADETHYFLVPFRGVPCGYALYTIRALPPGVGPVNSLPKARLFHLHDLSGVETMEKLLIAERKDEVLALSPAKSDLADRLDWLGEEIDRESDKVTYGILIVGGAVALINPLVGVGIAAKALFPSLGAKVSKMGLNYAGEKIRKVSEDAQNRRALETATSEVRKLKPETRINPLLVHLEKAVSTGDASHDPLLAGPGWIHEFASPQHLRITIDAVLAVYQEALDGQCPPGTLKLHDADVRWLKHLRDLSGELTTSHE